MAIKIDSFEQGVHPITPGDLPLQLLTVKREKGEIVKKHTHEQKRRETQSLAECLVVIAGKIKVDLYGLDDVLFDSVEISEGEAFITLEGGHEIEFLEDSQVFEIKNGPH